MERCARRRAPSRWPGASRARRRSPRWRSSPGRDIPLDVELREVWGVPVPEVTAPRLRRELDARGVSRRASAWQAHLAAERHEEALEALLAVCSSEVRLRRLGEELRKTARRIGALEEPVLPGLGADIRRIALALEEPGTRDPARRKRFKARSRGPG